MGTGDDDPDGMIGSTVAGKAVLAAAGLFVRSADPDQRTGGERLFERRVR